MLTLEENGWNFKAVKIYSDLNLLPLQIDMKMGKIRRQSSKTRMFLWVILFCLAIAHCIFMLSRLFQSMFLEPEKCFRWDHFIIHVPWAVGYSLLAYTGYCLFLQNPGECVTIYNQLFDDRENPVQKMMEQEQEWQVKRKFGKKGAKSDVWIELEQKNPSASVSDPVSVADADQTQEDLNSKSRQKYGIGARVRPLLTWPPQYSLDELLAKTLPLWVVITECFMLLTLALDPSRPQLLYSSLPTEHQNWYSFLVFLAVEAVFMTITCMIALFSLVCQLLFFSKCQLEFKQLDLQLRNLKTKFQSRPLQNRDLRKEIWILRQIFKEIKNLVLFIELFNRCFPPCIYAFKVICYLSILLYFFTIRHLQEFPFLAVFTGYVAITLTVIYGILYQKAFSIPDKMVRLKNEFFLSVQKSTSTSTPTFDNKNQRFRAEMKREIWAIRDVGVKVGIFHKLRRETTPIFADIVVKNVVNLLVTFP